MSVIVVVGSIRGEKVSVLVIVVVVVVVGSIRGEKVRCFNDVFGGAEEIKI